MSDALKQPGGEESPAPEPQKKLMRVTYGLRRDPKAQSLNDDPLPISILRYIQVAQRYFLEASNAWKAEAVRQGTTVSPALEIAAQDFGRFVTNCNFDDSRLNVAYIDDVLEGRVADEWADNLLQLSADRRAVVEATFEILGLQTKDITKITSVMEMLIADKKMREFTLAYLDGIVKNLGENVFRQTTEERPLHTASLAALPSRLRTIGSSSRREDLLYPHAQGVFAAWTVNEGGIYVSPPGSGLERVGPYRTIEFLRKLTAECLRSVITELPGLTTEDLKALADKVESQRRGWQLRDNMMGLAYNTAQKTGSGRSRQVDAYYWLPSLEGGENSSASGSAEMDDEQSREEGATPGEEAKTVSSTSRQIRIRPAPEAAELIRELTGPHSMGALTDNARKEVIENEVNPVLRVALKRAMDISIFRAVLRSRCSHNRYEEAFLDWLNNPKVPVLGDVPLFSKIYSGFAQEFVKMVDTIRKGMPKSVQEILARKPKAVDTGVQRILGGTKLKDAGVAGGLDKEPGNDASQPPLEGAESSTAATTDPAVVPDSSPAVPASEDGASAPAEPDPAVVPDDVGAVKGRA